MKGIFVQTTLYGDRDLQKVIESGIIGGNSYPIGSQVPRFENIPISFCSYYCKGYEEIYGNREGISFETDSPIVYACPCDSFNLLRSGHWLPGHEKFIFSSMEEMLKKYPTSLDFKKDFQEYFKKLNFKKVYPNAGKVLLPLRQAELLFEMDYCLDSSWNPGCNEVTFPKPFNARNIRLFKSIGELREIVLV